MIDQPIAHSRNAAGRRQPLVEHLTTVAEVASAFAPSFATDAAYWLGLWHDVGKFSPAFQHYLAEAEANPGRNARGPDHKAAGASLAQDHLGAGALVIQGHHGGLTSPTEFRAWLQERLRAPDVADAISRARNALSGLDPAGHIALPSSVSSDPLAAEMYLRMLLSALVDADRLDTERHFSPDAAAARGTDLGLDELWARFSANQAALESASATETDPRRRTVQAIRRAIREECVSAAELPPGLFRLTVPTGGGKTRSAMAFALRHALRHGLRRVIVAVPYLSITEQTAAVYRGIFEREGDASPVVLEHHSAVEWPPETDDGESHLWQRLGSENWDASVVVTTTVQLFESLLGNRTSAVRKLHRLAESVLILDEAQSLPPHLLAPVLDVLRQLCQEYGASVVLSTATQPAFEAIPVFASVPARDIVVDPARYFAPLDRVSYEIRSDPEGWDEIAGLLREESQALAIVNTKADALALLDALDDPAALHLSTLLCGAHRRAVIQEVRGRLARGEPCRLISTQVVEAGVDLDFPLVLRAIGPLDGMIQAAGRCNREGRLERGRVVIVVPAEGRLPAGQGYRAGTGIARALLQQPGVDLNHPDTPRPYYRQLFATIDPDRDGVQALRGRLDYPAVARRFRMIEPSENVVVTGYGGDRERATVRELLEELRRHAGAARLLLRRLQPYMLSLPTYLAERYRREGLVSEIMPGLGEWHGGYDAVRGLDAEPVDVMLV